ncbi:ComEC/Rec2 family competence protein [Microbacterium enclense]|uniref:ComEC/Rec2 family competence protein n=1 Tax=Microbacterium enclense TaxID=993073 RepID=UPI0036DC5AF8
MSVRAALVRRSLRPVVVALTTWTAAAVAVSVPAAAAVCGGLAAVALIAGAVFLRVRRAVLGVVVVAAACGAAAAGTVTTVAPLRATVAALQVDGGRHLVVEATAVGRLTVSDSGDVWFDAVATDIAAGREHVRGRFPARIGVPAAQRPRLADVGPGSPLVVAGTAFVPDGPERAVLVLRVADVSRATAPTGLWGWFEDRRDGLVASARGLPEPGAGLVPGLAVGDTSALDPATKRAMTATSLSHLTAVSGANCAIVVGAVFALLALCGAPRGVRVVGAATALAAFVILVTPEPSVVRAATMAAVAMIAVALGRPAVGVAVLSAAVTIVLIVDSWTSLSLGFALSAAATGALLTLARPLAAGLERWMPRSLALALAVPTSAQLACGPLIILIDPHVPLLGIGANLLADVAAAPATIAGALACIAPFPWLRDGLVAVAWAPAAWIAAVAHTGAGAADQELPWLEGVPGALALAGVGAATALLLLRPGRRVRRWRPVAAIVVALTVGVSAGHTAVRVVAGPLTLPTAWSAAMCDVGQGDATLWRSGDAIALVDTGPDAELLTTCLRRFGVDRLDLLVLTHFDLDHVGGSAAVVGRVDRVLHGPPADGRDESLLRRLADGGAALHRAAVGDAGVVGDTRWTVLWPTGAEEPGNDASVVVDVTGPGFPRMVLLGDLGKRPQAALGRRVDVPHVRIVKVSHHGSADQDPDLYRRLAPEVAFIGVGADNTYGHPTATLLSTLASLGTTTGRTDVDGHLAAWLDEQERLVLWRDRAPADTPPEPRRRAPHAPVASERRRHARGEHESSLRRTRTVSEGVGRLGE